MSIDPYPIQSLQSLKNSVNMVLTWIVASFLYHVSIVIVALLLIQIIHEPSNNLHPYPI